MRASFACLILLLLAACERSTPSAETEAATSRAPDRLMPRRPDQGPRAETKGDGRIKCSRAVASVPCEP